VQDLPAMQQRVQQYQEESHYVKTRLAELATIMEQPPVDLQPLNERLEKSSQQVEQLMQTISKQQFIYEQNQQIHKEYTDLLTKNQQTIAEVQSFARLAKGMTGENALKLSLERYCLQVYFEKVLQLANVRLQDLTQGRYRLSIGTEKGRTSRSTGLELMIFDDHTGEERRVQTLSGGESFIVSLALSLSLADVIQQQSGGIQIEALFIDEGFGTLDEQTLQLAIQTLAQLEGQGQLIGIISHVRELKEQIPRQIQVKKQGNGQSKITIHS
jgi:exonuclease SbcC